MNKYPDTWAELLFKQLPIYDTPGGHYKRKFNEASFYDAKNYLRCYGIEPDTVPRDVDTLVALLQRHGFDVRVTRASGSVYEVAAEDLKVWVVEFVDFSRSKGISIMPTLESALKVEQEWAQAWEFLNNPPRSSTELAACPCTRGGAKGVM